MNLYFRLMILLIKSVFTRKYISPMEESVCRFMVLPNDLDFNFHMNNGRYLTIMDLGRFDYMRHTGIFLPALKRKWFPILGATQMKYLRPLTAFQKYDLVTKVECWDEKWFVMSQRFESRGKVVAVGRIRGLMRGPQGNINPAELLKLMGYIPTEEDKKPSAEVAAWIKSLESL